ncbi:glycosyltransferase family 4 protein [Microvirga aerophila]|uniref:GDP-mannose-dependent alpha-mannosyltransferase n=1 Tax=Microvirga aerophila TaxID=670291 RepID=A0A512BPE8_9HYPH|nr:glycosyltransferase family 1 protein [Microvirga aerophila]GEO13829.1 GDP-mannose-dependent alpha-mannosyltransferase [Microvirga aerophila]
MRLLVATDAWHPQINGVVRSLDAMAAEAPHFGAKVTFLTPEWFPSVPLPTYGEIRLALASAHQVNQILHDLAPTHVHIATEGPVGLATRRACLRQAKAFTTSYHTRFPEYISARIPVREAWTYAALRRFHGAGQGTMVSTPSLGHELQRRGFKNIMRWTRGVDTDVYRPRAQQPAELLRPVFLYVGRIAVEKNLEAFLALDLPGTKVLVGDGPSRLHLKVKYPQARFLGALSKEALALAYSSADVFVFPSITDTFGIVLLEALASGLPIAAYPVTGPLDVIDGSGCGVLDWNLRTAALKALDIPSVRCRAYAELFTWRESARQFFSNIEVGRALRQPGATGN